ncbi:MAG: hypothetical protein KF785_10020 [Gemmatimonadales bacterium]|nr:hypothetical protein [Gemmatimonadales bacterium]
MAAQLSQAWLDAQLAGAPEELVARTREFIRGQGGAVTAEALARAGDAALATAMAESSDRTAALDLLAADALVTLALAAQTDADPDTLRAFAARLRRQGGGAA